MIFYLDHISAPSLNMYIKVSEYGNKHRPNVLRNIRAGLYSVYKLENYIQL